ncbi:MAG: Pr6Pr family membrane protein [Bacillota bacterium]|nr:Pr6Pr family membrane protein [Bacillota bacterium]
MNRSIFLYRVLLFAAGIAGIVLQVLDDGAGMFMYYTILSNLLVVLFLGYMLVKKGRLSDPDIRSKDGVAMAILITCVVYHFMLAPTAKAKDYYNIENFICHYILPLGFIVDSLFFDRVATKKTDPVSWSVFPVAYFIFALMNGLFLHIPIPGRKNFYPYFFVDVDRMGLMKVLMFCMVILIVYIVTGYLYSALKSLIHSRITRKISN